MTFRHAFFRSIPVIVLICGANYYLYFRSLAIFMAKTGLQMLKYFIIFILFISSTQHTAAQSRLSLSQAIKTSLRNNFQIQIAQKNLDIAENNNNWKTAGRYPSINLNFYNQNGFYREDNPAAYLGDPYTWSNIGLTGNIDLNYTLFDGHQAKINKKRLEQLEKQGNGKVELAIENSIRQTILAYYQALIEREKLRVTKEVLDLSLDRAAYERKRQQYGSAAEFEILQSQDALLNDSTNLLVQQNAYDISIRNLNLAMAESKLDKKYRLTDSLEYKTESYNFRTLQRKLVANNKELKQLEFEMQLAKVDTELEEAKRKPTISVAGGINQDLNFQDINALDPRTLRDEIGRTKNIRTNGYLNLSAKYPLFDGGNAKRNVKNNRMRESIAKLGFEEKKQQLSVQLKNTLETYNKQVRLLQLTEKLVDNARENMLITNDRFRASQINSFDFRSVQLAFINASQSKINALYNLKNTETELIRLIGGLVR